MKIFSLDFVYILKDCGNNYRTCIDVVDKSVDVFVKLK